MNDEDRSHGTNTTTILGRRRFLWANDDYTAFLLIDDGGGFEPDRKQLFEIINDLIERVRNVE